jgi:hypothetical protein
MTLKSDLQAARALIADIEHWCQAEDAIDQDEMHCDPCGPEAYCYCANGACIAVAGGTDSASKDRLNAMTDALGSSAADLGVSECGIVDANDGNIDYSADCVTDDDHYRFAHATVLRIFDHAIEHAPA